MQKTEKKRAMTRPESRNGEGLNEKDRPRIQVPCPVPDSSSVLPQAAPEALLAETIRLLGGDVVC